MIHEYGKKIRSPGGSFVYEVQGPVCRLYDREELPCPAVPSNGAASNQVGAELVAGLSLILLLVVVLAMPFEVLIPQERNGKASSRSTCTDSTKKKRSGGTEKEPYDKVRQT